MADFLPSVTSAPQLHHPPDVNPCTGRARGLPCVGRSCNSRASQRLLKWGMMLCFFAMLLCVVFSTLWIVAVTAAKHATDALLQSNPALRNSLAAHRGGQAGSKALGSSLGSQHHHEGAAGSSRQPAAKLPPSLIPSPPDSAACSRREGFFDCTELHRAAFPGASPHGKTPFASMILSGPLTWQPRQRLLPRRTSGCEPGCWDALCGTGTVPGSDWLYRPVNDLNRQISSASTGQKPAAQLLPISPGCEQWAPSAPAPAWSDGRGVLLHTLNSTVGGRGELKQV
jgi:hypothetical protein